MPLHYKKEGRVATFVIDNPPVNVFTPQLHKTFFDSLQDFLADRSIHVGILTATGERAFCAGDDIKSARPKRTVKEVVTRHLNPKRAEEADEYPGWEAEVLNLAQHRYKPIIGAVNGHALGQGLIYLLQLSDLRIASPNATFGLPEIAYGMAGASGVVRLGRQIPPIGALWLALTGGSFDAETALHYHLINEIVPLPNLLNRAQEIAQKIADHPPMAVRVEMESFYRSLDMSSDQAQALASHLYRLQRAAMANAAPPLSVRKAPAHFRLNRG